MSVFNRVGPLPDGHPFKGTYIFFNQRPQASSQENSTEQNPQENLVQKGVKIMTESSKNTQNSTALEALRQFREKYKDDLMSPEEGEALLKRMHFGERQVTFVKKQPTAPSPQENLVQALKDKGIRVKEFLKKALNRRKNDNLKKGEWPED